MDTDENQVDTQQTRVIQQLSRTVRYLQEESQKLHSIAKTEELNSAEIKALSQTEQILQQLSDELEGK